MFQNQSHSTANLFPYCHNCLVRITYQCIFYSFQRKVWTISERVKDMVGGFTTPLIFRSEWRQISYHLNSDHTMFQKRGRTGFWEFTNDPWNKILWPSPVVSRWKHNKYILEDSKKIVQNIKFFVSHSQLRRRRGSSQTPKINSTLLVWGSSCKADFLHS